MKNLYGLVPYRFYRLDKRDSCRSGFHGLDHKTRSRLPWIIVDLNRARPIHFRLVDGIKTRERGEGPWSSSMAPVEPGVLLAGKNCVATDRLKPVTETTWSRHLSEWQSAHKKAG